MWKLFSFFKSFLMESENEKFNVSRLVPCQMCLVATCLTSEIKNYYSSAIAVLLIAVKEVCEHFFIEFFIATPTEDTKLSENQHFHDPNIFNFNNFNNFFNSTFLWLYCWKSFHQKARSFSISNKNAQLSSASAVPLQSYCFSLKQTFSFLRS